MRKGLNMKMAAMGLALASMVACTGKTTTDATCCAANGEGNCPEGTCRKECTNACNTNNQKNKTMAYSKKYTNADFYKDGKFQQDVAMEAMKDMFAFYDVPFTELMAKDMWVTDFGLGDFENVGMGGIFWINDPEYKYFAHAIYLLPGQMIPEHAHVKTDFPAKHESWMVEKGWVYNFSEVGDETPNAPAIIFGSTLLIKGDDPSVGVYFTKDEEGATPTKVSLIVRNTKSEIIIQIPQLAEGQYWLSVTTQAGANYGLVKDLRTYKFPILLTIGIGGGGDSESPDEI